MSDFASWKADTIKKLEHPKASSVDERHWKNAYIRNLSPDDAAGEIDTRWYNANRPKTKRSMSAKEARKMARKREQ